MTKLEFLTELERRLKGLDRRELEDILTEYAAHIDNKIADGFTEEQVIESFGDLDDLIADIQSAYRVDPDFKYKSVRNYVAHYVNAFTRFVAQLTQCFLRMNRRQLAVFILRMLVLMALLTLLYFPVDFLTYSLSGLFGFLPHPLYRFIYGVIACVLRLFYLAVSAYIIYICVKQLLWPIAAELPPPPVNAAAAPPPAGDGEGEPPQEQNRYGAYCPNRAAQMTAAAADSFAGFLTLLLKIALLIVFIPAVLLLSALCVGLGGVIVLAVQGYPLIGVSILMLGLLLCGIAVCAPVFGFVVRREGKR